MKKDKVCSNCKIPIMEKTEDYYEIKGFHEGKADGCIYYHKNCFMNQILQKNKVNRLIGRAMGFIDKADERISA